MIIVVTCQIIEGIGLIEMVLKNAIFTFCIYYAYIYTIHYPLPTT